MFWQQSTANAQTPALAQVQSAHTSVQGTTQHHPTSKCPNALRNFTKLALPQTTSCSHTRQVLFHKEQSNTPHKRTLEAQNRRPMS